MADIKQNSELTLDDLQTMQVALHNRLKLTADQRKLLFTSPELVTDAEPVAPPRAPGENYFPATDGPRPGRWATSFSPWGN